jgi:hypothetical protein
MESISINLTRESSDIRTHFYPPLQLDPTKRHEIALIRLETYNSIPNIDTGNNVMRYEIDGVSYDIIIPTGAYELSQINDVIRSKTSAFELTANTNTLKAIIRINHPRVKIMMDHDASMRDMLGFKSEILEGVGDHEGSSLVKILPVNSIFVNCDVVTGSYINTSQKPILYSFFPNVPPGYKVVEMPGTPIYLPVTQTCIESMRLWLTDQERKPLNLRGETLSVWLVLKSYNK